MTARCWPARLDGVPITGPVGNGTRAYVPAGLCEAVRRGAWLWLPRFYGPTRDVHVGRGWVVVFDADDRRAVVELLYDRPIALLGLLGRLRPERIEYERVKPRALIALLPSAEPATCPIAVGRLTTPRPWVAWALAGADLAEMPDVTVRHTSDGGLTVEVQDTSRRIWSRISGSKCSKSNTSTSSFTRK